MKGDDLQTQYGKDLGPCRPTERVLVSKTYEQVEHANENGFHVTSEPEPRSGDRTSGGFASLHTHGPLFLLSHTG